MKSVNWKTDIADAHIEALVDVATPFLLLDVDRAQANIENMQRLCNGQGVELWPHIKTHKMVEIARRQLEAGAAGLTCAKIGEAEAILPAYEERRRSGGKCAIFIAHSLADVAQVARLKNLSSQLDELVAACTSLAHAPALERVLAAAGLTLPVMMAVDTGLGREGARGVDDAVLLAQLIMQHPHMTLRGLYTHEGHLYSVPPSEANAAISAVHGMLLRTCDAVHEATGLLNLPLWPGCSVSAERMALLPGVSAVRPGAYVFGDLFLYEQTQVKETEQLAVTVLATVVDRPAPGLALIDAGSKVFSSDRTPEGVFGSTPDGRDLQVTRVSEEHGFVTGRDVDTLAVGERLRFIPAHVCPVINLADWIVPLQEDAALAPWRIEGRGCVR